MVRISVSLILEKSFPGRRKSSITEHEINSLRKLDLSRSSIDEIDNLEVFSDITELCLRDNNIRLVENLIFLPMLEVLDLSDNKIQDAEALCIEDFPRSLRRLILSGNPCCACDDLLGSILARCPDVKVIIEDTSSAYKYDDDADKKSEDLLAKSMAAVYEDDPKNDLSVSSKLRDDDGIKGNVMQPEEDDPTTDGIGGEMVSDDAEYLVLDPEAILQQIVNRKCEMEGMQHFDLKHTMTMLNAETEVPKTRRSRMLNLEEDGEATAIDVNSRPARIAESKNLYDANLIDEWKKSCLTSNAMEAAHDADFISSLKRRMKNDIAAAKGQIS